MSKIYPYAGFWRRAVAFLIDSIIISIPCSVLYVVLLFSQVIHLNINSETLSSAPDASLTAIWTLFGTIFLFQVFLLIFFWLYFAIQESGKSQATLGKKVMGIKVVGADGGRISFARATGRLFAKAVSNMTLYFGYYMAGYTKKRQALHDLIATTYVVRDSFQPQEEKPELPFSTGGLIASILVAILPFILVALFILTVVFMAAQYADIDNEDQLSLKHTALLVRTQLLINKVNDENGDTWTPEKDGVIYTKTPDGFYADFADENGEKFTLLLKNDSYEACCSQGDCAAIDTKPCK